MQYGLTITMKRGFSSLGKSRNFRAGSYQQVLKFLLRVALILLILGALLSIMRITELVVAMGVWVLLFSPLISLLALAFDLAKKDRDSFFLTLLILTLLLVNIALLQLGL